MCSKEDLRNYALMGAKMSGDVQAVRHLLDKGANPEILFDHVLMERDTEKNHVQIIKTFFEYKESMSHYLFLQYFLCSSSLEQAKEIILHITEDGRKKSYLEDIFDELVCIDLKLKKMSALGGLEILKFLLDLGLTAVDHIFPYCGREDSDHLTPLHFSIENGRFDFVSKLCDFSVRITTI